MRVIILRQTGSAHSVHQTSKAIFPGISMAPGDNKVLVRDPVAVVDMIEDAIKKLDAPVPESAVAPNVELTVQLLQGSGNRAREERFRQTWRRRRAN